MIRTKIVIAALRIFSLPSVCQTEFNSHARRKIHWLALASRRFELDLLCCPSCRFIETVAQAAHHPAYLDGAVCQEYHFQHDLTLHLHPPPSSVLTRTSFP